MLNKYISLSLKIVISGAFFWISSIGVFAANGHPDMFTGNFETSCGGANVSALLYFGTGTTRTERVFDEFWWPQLAYIRDNSQIYTWDGNGGTLWADCRDANNWVFPSNVAPGNNIRATALENNGNCTFTRNNNPAQPFGQFNFRLSYATSAWIAQPEVLANYSYWQEGGVFWVRTFIPDQRTRVWTPARSAAPQFHPNECLNVFARWCWDSIVDAANGEQCDLGAQNGAVWSACSANCTNVVGPACVPGTVSWVQTAPVTATTVGLCPVGQTVGGFTSVVTGLTTSYVWSCNGSAVGGACTASFTTTRGWGGTSTPACFLTGTDTPSITVSTGSVAANICTYDISFFPIRTSVVNAVAWTVGTIVDGSTITSTLNGCTNISVDNILSSNIGAYSACSLQILSNTGTVGRIRVQDDCSFTGSFSLNFAAKWNNFGNACTTTTGGGGGGWTPTTIRTVPWSNSYCGNGIIERPNAAGQYESCDTVAPWCTDCNITSTNPGSAFPWNLTITTPGSSSMSIGVYKIIVGNGVSVFSSNDTVSFETNTPMYLENKIATVTNKASLINGTTVSKTIDNAWVGGIIQFEVPWTRTYDSLGNLLTITYNETRFPNALKLFDGSELQGFKGNTNTVASVGYKDTIVTNPTYRGQGIYASLQYLEAPFNIRVSKPIISNTAGWSAFIGSFLWNNVNVVVNNFLNALKNGNFTTSTVNMSSSYALSSATKSISDNNSISEIITSEGQNEEWKISQSSVNTAGVYMPTDIASVSDLVSKSVPLGDNESVRVFKNGDVSISGNMDLSGVKTIIVENGNLVINNDIRYADKTSSYAWIIKNGNVIVTNTVGNIAGMYITLAGAIVSNGISTSNRLAVDGSLYGNTSDLVNNRSYVRGQTDSTALNVGVVINYSNRAIIYPPPFFARFLEQYSLQRVAR